MYEIFDGYEQVETSFSALAITAFRRWNAPNFEPNLAQARQYFEAMSCHRRNGPEFRSVADLCEIGEVAYDITVRHERNDAILRGACESCDRLLRAVQGLRSRIVKLEKRSGPFIPWLEQIFWPTLKPEDAKLFTGQARFEDADLIDFLATIDWTALRSALEPPHSASAAPSAQMPVGEPARVPDGPGLTCIQEGIDPFEFYEWESGS